MVQAAHSYLNWTWTAWWSYWSQYIILFLHRKLIRRYFRIEVLYLKIDLFSISALAFSRLKRTINRSWLWNYFCFYIRLRTEINTYLDLRLLRYLHFWYALFTGFIILFKLALVKQRRIEQVLLSKYLLFLLLLLLHLQFACCTLRPIVTAAEWASEFVYRGCYHLFFLFFFFGLFLLGFTQCH